MFVPLFFLVVNVGRAARIFPSEGTPFLEGQNYGAFQTEGTFDDPPGAQPRVPERRSSAISAAV